MVQWKQIFALFYLEDSLEDVGWVFFVRGFCIFLVILSFSMIIAVKVLLSEEFL